MAERPMIEVARYRVMLADCGAARTMYFGNYFRLFEKGRAELFRSLGHPFPEYIARGLYLAAIGASCRYLKPAYYDDELIIRAAGTPGGPGRLTIGFEIVRPPSASVGPGRTGAPG